MSKPLCMTPRLLGSFPNAWTHALSGYQSQSQWTTCCVGTYPSVLTHKITTRPTVETRNSLQAVAQREAENTRVQLRKHHQTSVKKGKFGKHSIETEEVRLYLHRPRVEHRARIADLFVGSCVSYSSKN